MERKNVRQDMCTGRGSVQIEKEEKRFRNLLDVTDSIEEMVTMYRKLRSYKERDTFKRMLIRSFESKAARQED